MKSAAAPAWLENPEEMNAFAERIERFLNSTQHASIVFTKGDFIQDLTGPLLMWSAIEYALGTAIKRNVKCGIGIEAQEQIVPVRIIRRVKMAEVKKAAKLAWNHKTTPLAQGGCWYEVIHD